MAHYFYTAPQYPDWAVWAYYNKREAIEKMRVRGMKHDFSWKQSAKKYVEMYDDAQKAVE